MTKITGMYFYQQRCLGTNSGIKIFTMRVICSANLN